MPLEHLLSKASNIWNEPFLKDEANSSWQRASEIFVPIWPTLFPKRLLKEGTNERTHLPQCNYSSWWEKQDTRLLLVWLAINEWGLGSVFPPASQGCWTSLKVYGLIELPQACSITWCWPQLQAATDSFIPQELWLGLNKREAAPLEGGKPGAQKMG